MIKTILNFFKPTPLAKNHPPTLTTMDVCPSKLKKGQVLDDGCQVIGMSKKRMKTFRKRYLGTEIDIHFKNLDSGDTFKKTYQLQHRPQVVIVQPDLLNPSQSQNQKPYCNNKNQKLP